MSLQKTIVPVVLGGGIDTGTDKRVVQIGKLRKLEHGEIRKKNQVAKPQGFEALSRNISDGSSLAEGKKLATFNDELLMVSDGQIYSYIPSSDQWTGRGYISGISVASESIVRNTASQANPDVAIAQGVAVYAWEDSRGGIRATVVDVESGLPLQSDVSLTSTGSRPRVSATPQFLYVHYMDSSNTFKCRRLNPLEPLAFESAITLASDANGTNPNFDIAGFGNNLAVAYQTTGNIVKTGFIKSNGDIAGLTDGFPAIVSGAESGSGAIAIATRFQGDSNDAIYVFMHNTTDGLQCEIYATDLNDSDLVTVDAITTQVNQITAVVSGSQCHVFYEVNAAATYNHRIKSDTVNRAGTVVSSGTSTGTGNEFMRSVGIAGKAFAGPDDEVYFVASYESSFQPSFFTVRRISATRGVIANTISKDVGGGLYTRRSVVSNIARLSDDEFIFPATVKTRLVSESGAIFGLVGVQSASLTFGDVDIHQGVQLGQNLHIAGGVLQDYDGKSVLEHGFFLFPENVSNAITTTTGTLEAGTRNYVVVYEWTDNQGQVHQSAPSQPLSVTNALNDKNTLTIPTLRLTEKKAVSGRTEVSLAVYRTKASGTTYYRASSVTSPILNSTTSDTVTFLDNTPDSSIGSNQVLYTQGGILENIQPESSRIICEYADRAFLGAEDPNELQFSKASVKGEGLGFNEELRIRAEQGGKRITAIARMDTSLVIFKESKILVTAGDGPTDAGTQNDFRTPIVIPTDVGSPYPQSIAETPLGLIFKSKEKGFQLLTRGLSVEYIGEEAIDFSDLEVTSAVVVESESQVRFTHADGPTVIFDYDTRSWSTAPGTSAVSACMWQGSYCYLKSDGTVLQRSSTTYLLNGATVKTRIQLPWIAAAGLMNAQRIYRFFILGELKSHHKLRIKVSYDYSDSVAETFVIDTRTALGSSTFGSDSYFGESEFFGAVSSPYEFEVRPSRQKCKAISVELDDLNPEGIDGAGFVMTALAFEVGVKGKPGRVSASKRASAT